MSPHRQVRFLPAAADDLARLGEDDPELPVTLRIIRDLELGRQNGQKLGAAAPTGDLGDCRKLYFAASPDSKPTHRIVYRHPPGEGAIEIVEIIAIESREDLYVYLIAAVRLGRLPEESKGRFTRLHQGQIARRGQARKRRT